MDLFVNYCAVTHTVMSDPYVCEKLLKRGKKEKLRNWWRKPKIACGHSFFLIPELKYGRITSCPVPLGMEGIYPEGGQLSTLMEMEGFLGFSDERFIAEAYTSPEPHNADRILQF